LKEESKGRLELQERREARHKAIKAIKEAGKEDRLVFEKLQKARDQAETRDRQLLQELNYKLADIEYAAQVLAAAKAYACRHDGVSSPRSCKAQTVADAANKAKKHIDDSFFRGPVR
jgi:hypothetical protein